MPRNGIVGSQDITWFEQVLPDFFAEWLQKSAFPPAAHEFLYSYHSSILSNTQISFFSILIEIR